MLTPAATVLIATVALVVFGPKQLPELARSLGKAMGEFKKGLNGEPDPTSPPGPAGTAAVPVDPASLPPVGPPTGVSPIGPASDEKKT